MYMQLQTKASSHAGQCIPAGSSVSLPRRVLITMSIDYFLCSPNLIDSTVNNQILDHGENVSDHLAIMCNFVSNRVTADQKMSECDLSKYL